jgi:hypothetical protein
MAVKQFDPKKAYEEYRKKEKAKGYPPLDYGMWCEVIEVFLKVYIDSYGVVNGKH